MKGDDRTQKPYKKQGQIEIFKVEITEDTFKWVCKFLKVKRIGDKEIERLMQHIEQAQNHECPTRDEPSIDPSDRD